MKSNGSTKAVFGVKATWLPPTAPYLTAPRYGNIAARSSDNPALWDVMQPGFLFVPAAQVAPATARPFMGYPQAATVDITAIIAANGSTHPVTPPLPSLPYEIRATYKYHNWSKTR